MPCGRSMPHCFTPNPSTHKLMAKMTYTTYASASNSPRGESSSRLDLPESALSGLSDESRSCLARLASYRAPPLPDFGMLKQAAVLVVLFRKEGDDELHVLLTTRAKTLRRHPSQTALPGGKVDPEDPDVIYTARREAFEEVGLPMDHPAIHHIGIIDPVLTILPLNAHMKNHIVVVPVVCFVSDPTILSGLSPNPDEVDAIFTHPLKGCWTGQVSGKDAEGLSDSDGGWWPHEGDFHSTEDRIGTTGGYRMHRFRTKRTPIKGLTSDVLIDTATIAYDAPPHFSRYAPDQPPFSAAIAEVVLGLPEAMARASTTSSVDGERRVLEWGGTEVGKSVLSTEQYEVV
ncbi:hypothetical protein IAR55_005362 [Kwoniella newhampshirensis]|uniref:Nudix hydrolase domain-containing protein n=1 Tax=Kwoniella newhampshirensis TaxID=1651941 RepID=A0AAW0YHQ5_9TREE